MTNPPTLIPLPVISPKTPGTFTQNLNTAWTNATATSITATLGEVSFLTGAPNTIFIAAGVYTYTGSPLPRLTVAPIKIVGSGSAATIIHIPDNQYLFDLAGYISAIDISGIHFVGGAGVYRGQNAGQNVGMFRRWRDVIFSNYTECAVQENGYDMPLFDMQNCILAGLSGQETIGVALSGYQDVSRIVGNAFWRNKHNIKLNTPAIAGTDKGPGPNMLISHNDMTAFTGTTKVSDIWIVPNPDTATNSGYGLVIEGQKFGNENFVTGQKKILIADVDTGVGTDNGSQHTHATTKSDGYVGLIRLSDCNFQWAGTNYVEAAPIYSFARRLHGVAWGAGNVSDGAAPQYGIVQYDAAAAFDGFAPVSHSLMTLGPSENDGIRRLRIGSNPLGIVADPMHVGQSDLWVPSFWNTGQDAAFISLLTANNILTDGGVSGCTRSAATDILGGTNAAEITYSSSTGFVYVQPLGASMVAGRLAWAEIDLKSGTANAIRGVQVGLRDSAGNFYDYRTFDVPDHWETFRFPWFPFDNAATYRFDIRPLAGDYDGTHNQVIIGRPQVYHSRSPVNLGHVQAREGAFDKGHLVIGSLHFWPDTFSRLRVNNGIPATAGAGFLIGLSPTVTTRGDVDVTLAFSSAKPTQRFNSPLTVDRTVTLPNASLYDGAAFRLLRGTNGTGAFNLLAKQGAATVATLGVAGDWVDLVCDASTWFVAGTGSGAT